MTLLIGSISEEHIVLTADGLSKAHPTNGGRIESLFYQKIFPFSDSAIAIAHHGYNILKKLPVKEFLEKFIKTRNIDFQTCNIETIALQLYEFVGPAAKDIYDNPSNKGGIGFWVAGFGVENQAELFEILWPENQKPAKLKYPIFSNGNGKYLVEYPKDWKSIRKYPLDHVISIHNDVYRKAENKQKQENEVFGGHKHQLVIKAEGWFWTNEPKTIEVT